MLEFIRELLAVPLKIILWITGLIPVFDPVLMAKMVWEVSGRIDDGEVYLHLVLGRRGIEEGRQVASELMTMTNDAVFAATIAYAEYANKNLDRAADWVQLALDEGCDRPERLMMVQFMLANAGGDTERIKELTDEICIRNDLPMNFSALAYPIKSFLLLKEGRFDEAGQLAKKILSITEHPQVRLVNWALNVKNGEKQKADENLAKAQANWDVKYFSAVLANYCLAIGDKERAMEYLAQAEAEGFEPNWDRDLHAFAQTPEYAAYKGKGV